MNKPCGYKNAKSLNLHGWQRCMLLNVWPSPAQCDLCSLRDPEATWIDPDHQYVPKPLDHVLAPIRSPERPAGSSWEGIGRRKPWQYHITAAIPHLDTPELLKVVIATLRAQTVNPYILVIDCGSLLEHKESLLQIESSCDDIEIHYLHPKAWLATSQPVAVAMDLAFALCQSEYLYATHTDVFLKRPDYLAWLLARCNERTPAIGYQMSPRAPWKDQSLWKNTLSHTASLYHMPTMRRIGAHWNMLGAFEEYGQPKGQPYATGFPDTETMLSVSLQRAGIGVRWLGDPEPRKNDPPSICMIGTEENTTYHTCDLVHVRSITGHKLWNKSRYDSSKKELEQEVTKALERVVEWGQPRNRRPCGCKDQV